MSTIDRGGPESRKYSLPCRGEDVIAEIDDLYTSNTAMIRQSTAAARGTTYAAVGTLQ